VTARDPLPVNVPEVPTLTPGFKRSFVLSTTMNPPFATVKRAVPPESLVAVQPMKILAPTQSVPGARYHAVSLPDTVTTPFDLGPTEAIYADLFLTVPPL